MITDSVICLIGIGLTVPQVIGQSSSFDMASFDSWAQFLPQIVLVSGLIFKSFNKTIIPCIVSAALALAGMYFLLIFNSQGSSISVCSAFSSICAEIDDILFISSTPAVWEAFLYLIGLPISIVGATLLLKSSIVSLKSGKVSSAPKD